jgi:hypothetical protein
MPKVERHPESVLYRRVWNFDGQAKKEMFFIG